jgi:RecA-family ATPase
MINPAFVYDPDLDQYVPRPVRHARHEPPVDLNGHDHLRGMNAAELLALEIAPLRQAFHGLLPEGLGVIGAPPKAGKSLLAYQFGVELAFGGELFGMPAERRPVRYYALEDGQRRSQSRIRDLLKGRTAGLDALELQWTAPRLGGPLENEIDDWLDGHPVGVVIIDVRSKVRPNGRAGLNAYDEDYAAMVGLHDVARRYPGSVILLITHDRKAGSEDWMTRITGTRGVTGAADFVIFISRKRTETIGTIFVTGRDIEDRAFDVEFTGMGWRPAEIELVIGAKSETRQTIFHWVREHGPAWQKAIAEGTGIAIGTIYARKCLMQPATGAT